MPSVDSLASVDRTRRPGSGEHTVGSADKTTVPVGRLANRLGSLDRELSGLDALELAPVAPPRSRLAWEAAWPKLVAVLVAVAMWQVVVWTGWRSADVLPPPGRVFAGFFGDLADGSFVGAAALTLRRALVGSAVAVVIGGTVGLLILRFRLLRVATGSLLTGLQTMPSIVWFPLALMLFARSESAIVLVVVLGAGPSIANGIVSGVDQVPPLLDHVGRMLGAHGFGRYRHVIIPAALPGIVGGLKQAWAFAWRSLMAGELIVETTGRASIGSLLRDARDTSDTVGLLSTMLGILVIGLCVDAAFAAVERGLLARRGLGPA